VYFFFFFVTAMSGPDVQTHTAIISLDLRKLWNLSSAAGSDS
jgi:hypothetical protein